MNPGKRKRVCRNSGYWLYRPFEFIYFSFTRGATLAFSPSLRPNRQPSLPLQPLFLSRIFSRALSLSLSLHFHSDTSIQRRSTPFPTFARIHLVPSSTRPIEARASLTLFTHSLFLSISFYWLFIRDSFPLFTVYEGISASFVRGRLVSHPTIRNTRPILERRVVRQKFLPFLQHPS